MATFGASAFTSIENATSALLNASIAAGFTPASALGATPGNFAAAVLAAMLTDRAVAPAGISVGSGTLFTKLQKISATLTPAAVTINTAVEQTFTTFTGVTTDDFVVGIQKPTGQAGLVVGGARVVAADNVGIHFGNLTGTAITPTAGQVYSVFVARV